MPERMLRPGILTSEAVNHLSFAAEVFYRRLMSIVDDYGRFDGRASILRANLYPLKLGSVVEPDVEKWLAECAGAGLVRVYEVEKKRYVMIEKFDQRLRAKKSKWPEPADALLTLADKCPQMSASRGQARTSATETETETETNSETETESGKFPAAAGQTEIQIQTLKTQLQTLYNLNGSSWQLDGQLSTLAIELHTLKATAADLQAFWAYRRKKPALQYFHQDFLAWRANGSGAPSVDGQTTADDKASRAAAVKKALAEQEARSVRQRSARIS